MPERKLQYSFEELIQAVNIEELVKYHNWMTTVIPIYIKKDAVSGEEIEISPLNGFFEKEINFEPTEQFPDGSRKVYQSTFNLSFFAEDCPYEHPKWFRYWFYDALGTSWRHEEDSIYPYPPSYNIEGHNFTAVFHVNYGTK